MDIKLSSFSFREQMNVLVEKIEKIDVGELNHHHVAEIVNDEEEIIALIRQIGYVLYPNHEEHEDFFHIHGKLFDFCKKIQEIQKALTNSDHSEPIFASLHSLQRIAEACHAIFSINKSLDGEKSEKKVDPLAIAYPHLTEVRKKLLEIRKSKLNEIKTLQPEMHKKICLLDWDLKDLSRLYSIGSSSMIIDEKINSIEEMYKDLGVNDTLIYNINNKTSCDLISEIILNKITNLQHFIAKANHFMGINGIEIIRQLDPSLQIPEGVIIEAHSEFFDLFSETHNGGRKPLLVTLKWEEQEFKCVLKPRTAHRDKAIIEICYQLNELKINHPGYPLPIYTILQPEEGQGWKGLESMGDISIWEYVKGETARDSSILVRKNKICRDGIPPGGVLNLGNYIRSMLNGEVLLPHLQKMEQIFSKMHVADLTAENIIITDLDSNSCPTKSSKPIAIDLEASGSPTDLKVAPNGELSNEEIAYIDQNFQPESKWIQRIVLVGTQHLLGRFMSLVDDLSEIVSNVNDINDILAKKNYVENENHDFLVQGLTEDFLCNDVPYFTEFDGVLYYGLPIRGLKIGFKIN